MWTLQETTATASLKRPPKKTIREILYPELGDELDERQIGTELESHV